MIASVSRADTNDKTKVASGFTSESPEIRFLNAVGNGEFV